MKIKTVYPPFDDRSMFDLLGHLFLIRFHGSSKVLLGKLIFNHDIAPESRERGGDLPIGWGYNVTNGKVDGVVFYKPSEVDVLCMVAEGLDGKL